MSLISIFITHLTSHLALVFEKQNHQAKPKALTSIVYMQVDTAEYAANKLNPPA